MEAEVQYICRIADMTVCYNIKTAIQTVWNSGGTSDPVVIDWWASLCDAKTGACVQWLDYSHEVSGFSGFCWSPRSASDKKIHVGSSSNGNLLGKPRQSPVGRRSRKFARTTRATRMSSCFRSDPECRDVDASATGFGARPLDSGHQGKSDICYQRADKTSDHEDHEVRR